LPADYSGSAALSSGDIFEPASLPPVGVAKGADRFDVQPVFLVIAAVVVVFVPPVAACMAAVGAG
jgi:hypothetical protein